MKTLSEVHKEMEEEKELRVKILEKERESLLESSKGVSALKGKAERKRIYRELLKNHSFYRCPPMLLGIACDHCGTELIDKCPGSIKGYPPSCVAVCVGCGFRGYLRV